MTYETHAVTAPSGELDLVCVTLTHPVWGVTLRYVLDTQDRTIDGDLYVSTGFDADAAGTDDTGIDSRGISIPDLDLTLWRLLEGLAEVGSTVPVTVTISVYLSTDLSAPAIEPAVLKMASPSRSGRTVTFDASSVDTVNRDAPSRKFTWSSNPGLRR